MVREQNAKNKVVVYSKSYCPYCAQVGPCRPLGASTLQELLWTPKKVAQGLKQMRRVQVKGLFNKLNVDYKLFELDQIGAQGPSFCQ